MDHKLQLKVDVSEKLRELLESIMDRLEDFNPELFQVVGPQPFGRPSSSIWVDRITDNEEGWNLRNAKSYIYEIQESLNMGDPVKLTESFEGLQQVFEILDISSDDLFDEIFSLIDLLYTEESEVLYVAKEPAIYLPKLIVSLDYDLIQLIRTNPELLFKISAKEFEKLIAKLFFREGFQVHLTKRTRDGGCDIIAFHTKMDITSKYIIECKRYSRHRKVGLQVVQRLFGVKIAEHANKALVATTSTFSGPALNFASIHPWHLDLKDYDDIIHWIAKTT